jgi:hypothetical protein
MQGILFLKDCEGPLREVKPKTLEDGVWITLNKKTIAQIKMDVSDEILADMNSFTIFYEVWGKPSP